MAPKMSEDETRKELIDKRLKDSGWDVNDRSQILIEVDTINSNFEKRVYRYRDTTLKKEEKAYADYVLLDEEGKPIAVIEAKKTAIDPRNGQRQAERYVDDIRKTYSKDVLIYYTNGYEIHFWNKGHNNPRMLAKFHSREDLETIRYHNNFQKSFLDVDINTGITNRTYQIEAIKRVQEGIENEKKRRFLLTLATGTGKTRIAMSIIDVLLRSQRAKRILFLTDRNELNNQAFDVMKELFPNEAPKIIRSKEVNSYSRMYVSTLQTMINNFHNFSIGFFDVIIVDEAHRSIYEDNKLGKVLAYFDSIMIGLTATADDQIDRDTYKMFDCEPLIPTFAYTIEQASPKYLSKWEVYPATTRLQHNGIDLDDIPPEEMDRIRLQGIDLRELDIEGTELEKKILNKGTIDVMIKEFMSNCRKDDSNVPCKTIIFASSIQHARLIDDSIKKLNTKYAGELARVIVHEDSERYKLIKDFKKKSFPRIAVSVGMLDTGVDIPEVCNLVFMKSINSKIRFVQMIGRGTRHDDIIKPETRDWLPNRKKDNFVIFDFFSNFEFFDEDEGEEIIIVPLEIRIFKNRLSLYKKFVEDNEIENAEKIKNRLVSDIDELDPDSFLVKANLNHIKETKEEGFWNRDYMNIIEHLELNIMPLIKHKIKTNIVQRRIIYNLERVLLRKISLKGSTSVTDDKRAMRSIKNIQNYIKRIPDEDEHKELEDKLRNYLDDGKWDNLDESDILQLSEEFEPISDIELRIGSKTVVLDIEDSIFERGKIRYGPDHQSEMNIETYKMKVERRVEELAESNPIIKKIKNGEEISEEEEIKLSEALYSPELYISEEQLRRTYNIQNAENIDFIKHILKLDEFRDPLEVIHEEFRLFAIRNAHFSADQLTFIRMLENVFIDRRQIQEDDLYEYPFKNLGSTVPEPMFKDYEIRNMISMCEKLEKMV